MARTRSVTPPPMPADQMLCRWCGGTRIALECGAVYCRTGCAPNTASPYLRICNLCRREFETGRVGADLCHECDSTEKGEYTAAAAADSQHYGLQVSRTRERISRRIVRGEA